MSLKKGKYIYRGVEFFKNNWPFSIFSVFSVIIINKTKLRSRLIHKHLKWLSKIRSYTHDLIPDIDTVVKEKWWYHTTKSFSILFIAFLITYKHFLASFSPLEVWCGRRFESSAPAKCFLFINRVHLQGQISTQPSAQFENSSKDTVNVCPKTEIWLVTWKMQVNSHNSIGSDSRIMSSHRW